jgi:hypothetical protein
MNGPRTRIGIRYEEDNVDTIQRRKMSGMYRREVS